MHVLAIVPPDRWIAINLLDTLRHHYCNDLQVFHYPGGMGQLGSSEWRARRDELNAHLVREARRLRAEGRLDLIFCVVYDDFLLVDTAKQLRELNVPMVNYHVDMAFQWYRVIRTAPLFDVLAVAQMTNAEHLKPYAQHIHWMPMAANPDFYAAKLQGNAVPQHAVSFVGSFNPYRRALLSACVDRGIKPVVFGRGWSSDEPSSYTFEWDWHKVLHDVRYYAWPRWKAEGIGSVTGPLSRKWARCYEFRELAGPEMHGPCRDEDLPEIFRTSQINLGFSDTGWHADQNVVESKNLQYRLRDFEVPMSSGFYLVQEAPEHETYYQLGREIETWSRPEELVDKVLYYSRHPIEAERIRRAGHQRALSSHTWRHRFDRLFQQLIAVRTKVHAFDKRRMVHRVATHG